MGVNFVVFISIDHIRFGW